MARLPQRRNIATTQTRAIADGLDASRPRKGFALPYFTRDGGDTEYLISNPTASVVTGALAVFDKACKIAKIIDVKLKPNCTQSVRFRPIVPDNAGHSVLIADGQLIVHLLYMTGRGLVVEGGELAGSDNLFQWLRTESSRTYGFGYRALDLGDDRLEGSVFISNPHAAVLDGAIAFFDQRCEPAQHDQFRIKPGCTREFKFPSGRFGYGRVRVSNQAVINVLHFTASSAGLAAAEMVGESNLIDVPADPPQPGKKILFDNTHQCRPGAVGDWGDYEAALNGAGYTVAHHTAASVTLAALQAHDVFVIAMARLSYATAEKDAISSFVNQGGGLLIVQDFGNAPWSGPTREMLNLFGANDDNNTATDPTDHDNGNPNNVVFDYQRNFHAHPIVNGWKYFNVSAAATLSGAGWTTIAETDDDSVPARRPVLLGRAFGQGRVVAFGDSNTWANHMLPQRENQLFGVRCAEWLLFQI